ncbi:T-cell activation inhibitor, mitochondrial isoform X3 [Stigmatopora argus]
MSLHCLLRGTIRLERKHVATRFFLQRALSGAEVINALRPFYFAVHPDFFGQYPRERQVNENSLKRLNGYLENLQKPGSRSVQPIKLTFYVRETKDSSDPQQALLTSATDLLSGIRAITPSLASETLRKRSCSRPPESSLRSSHHFFASMWLQKNEAEATKKHNDSLPRRKELKRLKEKLCLKFDLADIRWQRSWGVAHRCAQLQSLNRLSMQNPEAMLNLQGHTVVFADQSGMNASGDVMLGTTDVHHQWTKLFEQLSSIRVLHQQTQWLKERISLLLGGVEVIHTERLGPAEPITELYSSLCTFHNNLISQRLCLHPRSLEGLSLILEKGRSSPRLHEMGQYVISTNCDPARLQAFLQSHASIARERTQHQKLLQAEEDAVIELCLHSLSLQNLSKEPSVTCSQMILCCKRLLDQRSPLMLGLHICVSHFYSLMQDGDLCIPWDWKS